MVDVAGVVEIHSANHSFAISRDRGRKQGFPAPDVMKLNKLASLELIKYLALSIRGITTLYAMEYNDKKDDEFIGYSEPKNSILLYLGVTVQREKLFGKDKEINVAPGIIYKP